MKIRGRRNSKISWAGVKSSSDILALGEGAVFFEHFHRNRVRRCEIVELIFGNNAPHPSGCASRRLTPMNVNARQSWEAVRVNETRRPA